ncbi:hypothetical protein A7A78_02525 [Aequorivita soesokkakensis]|jgi:hypothetical protein|uniref:Uncharacterized protein n=1 Tax=Aequorivita soesokkakensis TaxID=1385699 RepID=A0A1A9LI16_9FLAO|nr:hypothetical protein [Aequorivita soesokkakensis]OAD92803.1 hypothetical protein A7A78_02525 [Aequorivita soesokkakensis]
MKINTQENAIDIDDLQLKLLAQFPKKYKVTTRNKDILVVAQSKTCGALVIRKKNSIVVNGNFPTMAGQMIFTLLMVGLGILIPLIIYYLVFHKKMKVVEKEVGEFIKEEYKSKLV